MHFHLTLLVLLVCWNSRLHDGRYKHSFISNDVLLLVAGKRLNRLNFLFMSFGQFTVHYLQSVVRQL